MLIHLVWRCNWWQTKRILEGKKHQLHWKLKTSVMANLNLWNKLWNKWWILKSVAVGLLLLIIGFQGVLRKVWYLVLKTFLYTFVFTEFSPGNPLKYLLYVYHGRVTQDLLQSSTTNSCRCTQNTFDKHNNHVVIQVNSRIFIVCIFFMHSVRDCLSLVLVSGGRGWTNNT